MWTTALGINTIIWSILGVFLVYSTGTLFLQGAWHQFLLAALLWGISCFAGLAFAPLG